MRGLNLNRFPFDLAALPPGWSWSAIGDVAEVESGFASGKHNAAGRGIPHLRPMNISRAGEIELAEVKYITGDEANRRLSNGDVLFNNTNSPALVGKTAAVRSVGESAFSNHMTRVRGPEELLPGFVARQLHYLWSRGYFKANCVNHVNQASFASSRLASEVPLLVAPPREQHRIVSKLDELFSELDAGVAALERAQVKLERYRASVLRAAVEGRLTEQWRPENPSNESGAELLQRILVERRRRWEEEQLAAYKAKGRKPPKEWREKYEEPSEPDTSELPELPGGWCWVGLAQVAFFQNGRAFPSKEYAQEGLRLLRPGNLHASGRVIWNASNTRHMPEEWGAQYPGYLVRGGELVMNLTAQSLRDEFLGRACMTGPHECCLLNQRLARISPLPSVSPKYLLGVLKAERFRRFVDGLNSGSLIQHMFTTQLADFVFPLPPLREQECMASVAWDAFSGTQETVETIVEGQARATHLRQAILKYALEGRLVPQDPNDEPASALLERIRAERPAAAKNTKPQTHRRRKKAGA